MLFFPCHVIDRRTMVNFAQAPAVSTSCVTLGRAPFTLWTSGPSSVLSTTVSPSEAGTTNGSPTLKWMVRLAKQNMVFMRHICFTLIYQWGHNGWQLKRQNGLMCIRCNSVVSTFSNPGPNWNLKKLFKPNVQMCFSTFSFFSIQKFCSSVNDGGPLAIPLQPTCWESLI